MPSLNDHELNISSSRVVKDLRGQVHIVGTADSPIAIYPPLSLASANRAVAVRIYAHAVVFMAIDRVVTAANGALLQPGAADAHMYHEFGFGPRTDTLHFIAPAATTVHLTWFIGA